MATATAAAAVFASLPSATPAVAPPPAATPTATAAPPTTTATSGPRAATIPATFRTVEERPAPHPIRLAPPRVHAGPAAALAEPEPRTEPEPVRAEVRPVAAPASSSSGASAVELALSKIGSPYRWGAEGPNAFDCSGLVQWAFGNAGVELPRTSRAQSQVGERVSRSELQPGDLVFFYSPVSHVGIYLGGGEIVHASTSGQPVKVSDLDRMPFTTARRV